MITIRKNTERGATKTFWLDSKHTFSFGSYYDLKHMNFGALRVINEDKVTPGNGFGAHSHKDMEIISYVLEGALEHKDSLGTGSIIMPGEVQLMRAGAGISIAPMGVLLFRLGSLRTYLVVLSGTQRGLIP